MSECCAECCFGCELFSSHLCLNASFLESSVYLDLMSVKLSLQMHGKTWKTKAERVAIKSSRDTREHIST